MPCKVLCESKDFRIQHNMNKGFGSVSAYEKGYKYCSVCKWYVGNGVYYCPCCGRRTRVRKMGDVRDSVKRVK